MGLNSSSVHVGNASSRPIRARVAQEETHVTEVDASLGLSLTPPFRLSAQAKTTLDRSLDVTGFARVGPGEALEFDLPRGKRNSIFVSVTTADDPSPLVICFNYTPPHGKSIIVTENGTIVLSEEQPPNKLRLQAPDHAPNHAHYPSKPTNERVLSTNNGQLALPTAKPNGNSKSVSVHLPTSNGRQAQSNSNKPVDVPFTTSKKLNSPSIKHKVRSEQQQELRGSYRLLASHSDSGDGSTGATTWITPEGICYTAAMARRIHRQDAVDAAARRLQAERGGQAGGLGAGEQGGRLGGAQRGGARQRKVPSLRSVAVAVTFVNRAPIAKSG